MPTIVAETSNPAYAEAIKLIRKIGKLMDVQDQAKDFTDYVTELRVQFKPKRNFVKLLDDLARSKIIAK